MLKNVAKSGMMEHFTVHVYCLWLCSLAITMQSWPGRFMVLWCFLCPGAATGSTGSGSSFKASQKMGPQLKVSSDRLG